MPQLSLFDPNPATIQPDQFGLADVSYADATAILTRPTGRLADLDFALNPYPGLHLRLHLLLRGVLHG